MKKIRVLLIDDHQIFRDGIASLFSDVEGIELIGVLGDAWEALGKITRLEPDVLVVDISMPGLSGIEFIERLNNKGLLVNTLILSMHTQDEFVFKALSAGAIGYLPKQETSKEELVRAITEVAAGRKYIHERIAEVMKEHYRKAEEGSEPEDKQEIALISAREMEVLKLVVEGLSNQEIADRLFVNIRTVETHKTNILQKLDLKNTVDLVKFAIRNKLVEV